MKTTGDRSERKKQRRRVIRFERRRPRVGVCKTRITIDRTGHACVRITEAATAAAITTRKLDVGFPIASTRFPVSMKPNRSKPRRCFLGAVYRSVETPGRSQHRSNVARTSPLLRTAFSSSFPRRTGKEAKRSEKPSSEISGRDNSRCDNERKIWALLRLSAS